jgi:hypothetical protein
MIVYNFNVMSVTIMPLETNTPKIEKLVDWENKDKILTWLDGL